MAVAINSKVNTNNHLLSLCDNTSAMLVSLTVGKVDAGVAVLLTEDKRLVSAYHDYGTPMKPNMLTTLLPD